jgi:prepilin signal peptidase PulO-like enzyme (type II secretory pathway)
MEIVLGFFFFIFGTLIGSFLNVVILRYNTGKNLSGRSRCQSCGKILSSTELFPVFSFLFQKGVCKGCGSKISIQYPIVEFSTGILFLLVFLTYTSVPQAIFSLIIVSILIIITAYDIKHEIIPNSFVYIFIGMSLFSMFFNMETFYYSTPSALDLFAGPALAIPIWLLWLFSNGKWIGLGDAKIFLGVGWFLGIFAGVTAFFLSFWIGAIVGILLVFISKFLRIKKLNLGVKELTIKDGIPFAPFIIASFLLVYFFEFNLISIIAP